MAFIHSPKIVTDGLVYMFDAANPKSYTSGSSTISNLMDPIVTGSVLGSPDFSSNNLGQIVFNGSPDWIRTSDTSYLNPDTGSFSVVCWASGNFAPAFAGWVVKRVSPINGYYLGQSATNITWIVANSSGTRVDSSVSYVSGSWGMYTGIINRFTTQSKLVVNNNTQIATQTVPTGSHTNTANFGIGLDEEGGNWTNGSIAAVMVYNKALSETEITQNFNAFRGRFGL